MIVDSLHTNELINSASMLRPHTEFIISSSKVDTIYLSDHHETEYIDYAFNIDIDIKGEYKIFVDTSQTISLQDNGFWDFPPYDESIEILTADDEIDEELEIKVELDHHVEIDSSDNHTDHDPLDQYQPDPIFPYNDYEFTTEEWKERKNRFVQGYPVFLYNSSDSATFLVHQDGMIPMIQEAKDENGVWRAVEYWTYSWCGNSYIISVLEPSSILVTGVYKYVGNYETELRLKTKIDNQFVYSNSFRGSINKSQFQLSTFFENRSGEFIDRRLFK